MDKEKIKDAIKALNGLSYYEWQKVSLAVDTYFRKKEIEHKSKLKLDNCEELAENYSSMI